METESESGLEKRGLLHMLRGFACRGQGYRFWCKTSTHPFSMVALLQSPTNFSQNTFINRQRGNSLSEYFCFFEKTCVRKRFLKVVSKWLQVFSSTKHNKALLNMKSFFTAFCIMLLLIPASLKGKDTESTNSTENYNGENIVFVPGWQASKDDSEEYKKYLNSIYNTPSFIFFWESNKGWKESKTNSIKAATDLTNLLASLKPEQQKEITLIGHSLGARVITNASEALASKNIRLKRIVFLGAAVDYDAEQLKDIGKVSIESPINVFSRDDGVLKYAYGNMENKVSCGCYGIAGETDFKQYTYLEKIDRNSDIVKKIETHFSKNYFNTLKSIKDDKLKPVTPTDVKDLFNQIEVTMKKTHITHNSNFYFPAENLNFFNIIHEKDGWQYISIEKKISIFKHEININAYAIADPLGRFVVFGNFEKSFQDIWGRLTNQLNEKEEK